MPAAIVTLTEKTLRDRIKTILDADANLQALTASTSPPGPPTVTTSFFKAPTTFPAIMVDLNPQNELTAADVSASRQQWIFHFLLRIFTQHGDMDQARDDARRLFDYMFLALSDKPALQTSGSAGNAIVHHSAFGALRSGITDERYIAIPTFFLEVDFNVMLEKRRRLG